MEGYRFLTKTQFGEKYGLGKRLVNEIFATPGFPARGGKNETKLVQEAEADRWMKSWRR